MPDNPAKMEKVLVTGDRLLKGHVAHLHILVDHVFETPEVQAFEAAMERAAVAWLKARKL